MKHAIHILEFGNELHNFIDTTPQNQLGGKTTETQEIDKILADVLLATRITAALARQVENLMQGDITRATFLKRYKNIEDDFKSELAG